MITVQFVEWSFAEGHQMVTVDLPVVPRQDDIVVFNNERFRVTLVTWHIAWGGATTVEVRCYRMVP